MRARPSARRVRCLNTNLSLRMLRIVPYCRIALSSIKAPAPPALDPAGGAGAPSSAPAQASARLNQDLTV
jgi:hypothetical protein